MFSQACIILSTIGPHAYSVTAHPCWLLILVGYSVTCYGAVGTHPTGMLTCYHVFLLISIISLVMFAVVTRKY